MASRNEVEAFANEVANILIDTVEDAREHNVSLVPEHVEGNWSSWGDARIVNDDLEAPSNVIEVVFQGQKFLVTITSA